MNVSLLLDLYELTMAQSYFIYRRDTQATFDLFVRRLPENRAYLVSCGLADVLDYIRNLRFSRDDLDYLKTQRLFSEDFLKFLSNFKFSGDIWAMPEGEVFFAEEPVIRVTAPIIEAQLLETYLLNAVNLSTMIASKAARVVSSCKGKAAYDFSLRRTHGVDAGIKVARSSYIAGFKGTSNVLAGKVFGIPCVGTMAHSFVMSFNEEIDSFLAYSETFPQRTILLVDTYDTRKGVRNAVTIGKYLREKGYRLLGIRLDSGDLVSLSKFARAELDRAGLTYVRIFASGNLDEFKIKELLDKGAKVDSFGVGTNMGTSIDAPALDVIYKLSEVTDDNGYFIPAMKLSKGKVTHPGRKQVYRLIKKGKAIKDILALEKEKVEGRPLLVKVTDKGRIVYQLPSTDKIRASLQENLKRFSREILEVYPKYRYPVSISPGLRRLEERLGRKLEKG